MKDPTRSAKTRLAITRSIISRLQIWKQGFNHHFILVSCPQLSFDLLSTWLNLIKYLKALISKDTMKVMSFTQSGFHELQMVPLIHCILISSAKLMHSPLNLFKNTIQITILSLSLYKYIIHNIMLIIISIFSLLKIGDWSRLLTN